MSNKPATELLKEYTQIFTSVKNNNKNDELEVVFGSKKALTRIEFEDVISKIKSLGFTSYGASGKYHLNIHYFQ